MSRALMGAYRTSFRLCSVLVAVSLCTASCRFFSKARLASSSEQAVYPEKLKRLKEEFARIYEQFPQPEFQAVARAIYARFVEIYTNPEKGLRKPALFFVLNSLPGTGKTFFVQEIARALGIQEKQSYRVFEVKPTDYFLDFRDLSQFAIPNTVLTNPDPRLPPEPALFLYDEYTLVSKVIAELIPTKEEDVARFVADVRVSIDKLFEESNKAVRRASDVVNNTPEFAEAINRLNSENTLLYRSLQEVSGQLAVTYNRPQDFAEFGKQLHENVSKSLEILWSALGNGTLPKTQTLSNQSISTNLLGWGQQIADNKRYLEQERIKLMVQTLARDKKEQDLKAFETREMELASARPARQNKVQGDDEDTPQSLPVQTIGDRESVRNLRDAIANLNSSIRESTDQVTYADRAINQVMERAKGDLSTIARSVGPKAVGELVARLGGSPEQIRNEKLRDLVGVQAAAAGLEAAEALSYVEQQMEAVSGGMSMLSGEEQLAFLYRRDHEEFLAQYQATLANVSPDQDKYVGNSVIILAGNVLKLQQEVLVRLAERGQILCQGVAHSKVPYYRNPDCVKLVVEQVIAEPGSSDEMKTILKDALGASTLAQAQADNKKDNNVFERNPAALDSRLGEPSFISPPDSEAYRLFIRRDLAGLAKQFTGYLPNTTLDFDESVVEDLLFVKYANAHLGLRALVDKTRAQFELAVDTQVVPKVMAYNVGGAAGGESCPAGSGPTATGKTSLAPAAFAALQGQPITRVTVRFEPSNGNQGRKSGTVIFTAFNEQGQQAVVQTVDELAPDVAEIPFKQLSEFDIVLYANYIGALYGSMGVLLETLPSEPLSLSAGSSGVPAAAKDVRYLDTEFRRDLALYSLEIQAYIAGIAGFVSIAGLVEPPPELQQLRVQIGDMIGDLWVKIIQAEKNTGASLKELLARDRQNDVAGQPLAKVDPLLKSFLDEVSRPGLASKELSPEQIEKMYQGVFSHLKKQMNENPGYLQVMRSLALLVQQKLQGMVAKGKGYSKGEGDNGPVIDPAAIEEILRVVDIRPSMRPGAPGFNRCATYVAQFGIPVAEDLPPLEAAARKGLFMRFASWSTKTWSAGWARQNKALKHLLSAGK